jgi:hypothetical protein
VTVGTCGVCGHLVAVNSSRHVIAHQGGARRTCPGSGGDPRGYLPAPPSSGVVACVGDIDPLGGIVPGMYGGLPEEDHS